MPTADCQLSELSDVHSRPPIGMGHVFWISIGFGWVEKTKSVVDSKRSGKVIVLVSPHS